MALSLVFFFFFLNNLHIFDTPPGLQPCEKGRRKMAMIFPPPPLNLLPWSPTAARWKNNHRKKRKKDKSKRLPRSTFPLFNRTSKEKKCVLTKWKFHTRTDLCVYIDHVVLGSLSSMCFKSTFFFLLFLTIRCKMWKFGSGCL